MDSWLRGIYLFLELDRAEVAEVRVATLSIIKPFDIFIDSRLAFLASIVSFPVYQLHL